MAYRYRPARYRGWYAVNLKADDANSLCETCHGTQGKAGKCRHVSDVPADAESIPDVFRGALVDGAVVCSTCHDIVYQCEHPRIQYSYENPGFLRDRTSRRTGQYCVRCHEPSAYAKLNPHVGVAGDPPGPTCALCHQSIPESDIVGGLSVSFNMKHDLNDTCRGCHNIGPHPRNLFSREKVNEWVHLVVPSAEIVENMREAQATSGIELPLDPLTGKVFCGTCHNPHEFKVGGAHGSQERAIEHRLRIHDICQACHDK